VHFVLVSLAADTTLAANGRFGGEPVVSEAAAKDLPRDVEKGSPQFVAAESMATNQLFGFDSYSQCMDCPLSHLRFESRLHSTKFHLLSWRPSLRRALSAFAEAALWCLCLLLGASAALPAQLHESQPAEEPFVQLAPLPPAQFSEAPPLNQQLYPAAGQFLHIDEAFQVLVDTSQCGRTWQFVQTANGFARQQEHCDVELLLWHQGLHVPGTVAACWAAPDVEMDTKRALAEMPAVLRAVWTVLFEFAHHFHVAACNSGLRICLNSVLVFLAFEKAVAAANWRCGGGPVVSEAAATDLHPDVEKESSQFEAAESMATNQLFGFDSHCSCMVCSLSHLQFESRLHSTKFHLLSWRPSLRRALSAFAEAALGHVCLLLGAPAALPAQLHETQPAEEPSVQIALLPPAQLAEPPLLNQQLYSAAE